MQGICDAVAITAIWKCVLNSHNVLMSVAFPLGVGLSGLDKLKECTVIVWELLSPGLNL